MARKRERSEDEAWALAVNDHPEYRKGIENGTLPDEIAGDDGEPVSPRMHLAMHAIVERQIATDEPAGVAAVAQALAKSGMSRHDIRHTIALPLTEQIWYMQKEGCPFDEKRYLDALQKVVDALPSCANPCIGQVVARRSE